MLNEKRPRITIAALIISLFAFCLYLNTLSNDFTWDDRFTILDNEFIKESENFSKLFSADYLSKERDIELNSTTFLGSGETSYRPMVTFTYMLDYKNWGINPMGYHLSNILLHALCTFLLTLFCYELFRDKLIAIVSGILFAFNPLASETVNAVSFREDLLCLLFILLSLIFMNKARLPGKQIHYIIIAAISAMLACLSKEIGATLPLLTASIIWLVPIKNRDTKQDFLVLASISLAVLVYFYLYFILFKNSGDNPQYWFWKDAEAHIAALIQVHTKNLGLFFYPSLSVDHYIYKESSLLDAHIVLRLIVLIAATIYTTYCIRSKRPESIGLIFVIICLLPVSGIFPLRHIIAERYLYIPLAGFAIWASWVIVSIATRLNSKRRLSIIFISCLIPIFSIITFARNQVWKNDEVLNQRTLEENPLSYHANFNVARSKMLNGDYEEAIKLFKTAHKEHPFKTDGLIGIGGSYHNMGEYEEALQYLEKAVRMNPQNHINLGWLGGTYIALKKLDEAKAVLNKALSINPEYAVALSELGRVHLMEGNETDALKMWEKALSINPDDPVTISRLKGYQDAKKIQVTNYTKNKDSVVRDLMQNNLLPETKNSFSGSIHFLHKNDDSKFVAKHTFESGEKYKLAILFLNPSIENNQAPAVIFNLKVLAPDNTVLMVKNDVTVSKTLTAKAPGVWYLSEISPEFTINDKDIPGEYTFNAEFHDLNSGAIYRTKNTYILKK